MMKRFLAGSIFVVLAPMAGAEVKLATADAMLIQHQFQIGAPVAKVWESLVHPNLWWPPDHTWSGKREALSLEATAGGCYCERWDGRSARHGHVVMVVPQQVLSLDAALGPFLEMAVSGILSIKLSEKDAVTTAIVTYRVSGDPAHKLDVLAPIVDQVIGQQFGAFAADAAK